MLDHFLELIVADLPVEVQVCLDDCPVHQLLQLQVCQVVPNHHLQDREELSVGDVAVLVDVIDLEGETQLLLVVGAIEGGDALEELLEGNFAVGVDVED